MTSRERVLATLNGAAADRVPLNVFAGWNPGVRARVEARHGQLAAFEDRFRIDVQTGVLPRFPFGRPEGGAAPTSFEPYLDMQPVDPIRGAIVETPCDGDLFPTVREAVAAGRERSRAVFAHAWGVFELSQFLFERDGRPGTEDALLGMIAEPDVCRELYLRLGRWTADCVEAAIDAGVDAIELSDDWGQQNTMLFSPRTWWDLVFEPTREIVDRARSRGTPVIIHSDGDVSLVLDGIRQLGVQGLHPVQESAGMKPATVRTVLGPEVCIMGGLDTVSALPNMSETEVVSEVERVFAMLKDSGPFIFAGSHMFQDDTEVAIIEAAYDRAFELASYD
jgi:uroporphyrinogen decarboxylase